eukprot:CAMPEP_0115381088 /NCGR_PEP_ID=MMETSP0271-20121206/5387_1 /TAXON_ID=71861 /ORGANISM="Scrippsiella trochoidea, Strain CCMP3099" /LENGTH=392 /DNA_ID=CAMNT_0002804351 /DNA_START=26 /DNA_END=1204 /DNA_ORIENTATION=+
MALVAQIPPSATTPKQAHGKQLAKKNRTTRTRRSNASTSKVDITDFQSTVGSTTTCDSSSECAVFEQRIAPSSWGNRAAVTKAEGTTQCQRATKPGQARLTTGNTARGGNMSAIKGGSAAGRPTLHAKVSHTKAEQSVVSDLRTALRSKGQAVMVEVTTSCTDVISHVPLPSKLMDQSAASTPAASDQSRQSWLPSLLQGHDHALSATAWGCTAHDADPCLARPPYVNEAGAREAASVTAAKGGPRVRRCMWSGKARGCNAEPWLQSAIPEIGYDRQPSKWNQELDAGRWPPPLGARSVASSPSEIMAATPSPPLRRWPSAWLGRAATMRMGSPVSCGIPPSRRGHKAPLAAVQVMDPQMSHPGGTVFVAHGGTLFGVVPKLARQILCLVRQ